MKLSLNGKIERVLELNDKAIVEFSIPSWHVKNIQELNKEKPYNLMLTDVKSRKTLEQNSKAWALMNEIALQSDMLPDKNMVYKQVLELSAIQSAFVMTTLEAEAILKRTYRVVINHGERDYNDKTGQPLYMFECLLGMSNFNRKETARFIENLLYFAEQVGVNTAMYE